MGEVRIVSMDSRVFADRQEAGEALAAELADLKGQDPVILGIPRGAVPMAAAIADALEGELDVVIVRKLGAPGNPELAIGAVTEEGEAIVNRELAGHTHASEEYIAQETQRQAQRIDEARRVFRRARPKVPLGGRVVAIVDDGFATGATMKAALESTRSEGPKRLIAAAPVGARDTVRAMAEFADEVVCLRAPRIFGAVGAFYLDFGQVSDEEVLQVLRERATS